MILPAQRGAARVAIKRAGSVSSIMEPVDTDSVVDGYGKTAEDEWQMVSEEPVVRIYQRGTGPTQSRVSGGTYRTESPVLIFLHDSEVGTGYRVSYQSTVYEIDSLTVYPTHIESETTVVN